MERGAHKPLVERMPNVRNSAECGADHCQLCSFEACLVGVILVFNRLRGLDVVVGNVK